MVAGGFIAVKFKQKIDKQFAAIESLKTKVSSLESRINANSIFWSSDSYNYLALGNSITKHGICDYWWDQYGMAASSPENDYFHLVSNYLQSTNDKATSFAYNFSIWETMATDRSETFDLILPYLSSELDLITIQLGENVHDMASFESDFSELVSFIRSKCSDAMIIVIGDFWNSPEHDRIKKTISDKNNIAFVSLSEIADSAEYQAGTGYTVSGSDGSTHSVQHNGVAKHPNDKGMQYIADGITNIVSGN